MTEKTKRNRIWIITGVLSCLIAITTLVNSYPWRPKELFPMRAAIVDRNGEVLAQNIESGHILLFPKKIKDKNVVASFIHELYPDKYSISDALKLTESQRIKHIEIYATDSQIRKVLSAHIPGVQVLSDEQRIYPKHNLFSHVVGFFGKDAVLVSRGLYGAERIYNEYLRDNNKPLQLSLDTRIQSAFYEHLSAAVQKYNAKSAIGMLMNSRTGEMIAMVQLPDFDPNHIKEHSIQNIVFKPMHEVMEMGPVFKIFNTALAYENGVENKEYKVDEPLMIYDKNGTPLLTKPIDDIASFKQYVIANLGKNHLKPHEIMLNSCNVGSAQIALDLPNNAQQDFFHRFHLDTNLNLEFGQTEKTLLPTNWGPVERAKASFGYGIAITPIHLLLAVNAITNGGTYVYPTLLKARSGAKHAEHVLDSGISDKLRKIMISITEGTSANKAKIHNIEIGTKTATVEKENVVDSDKTKSVSTIFLGVFPGNNPQYIMLLILDEPKGIPELGNLKTAAWNVMPTAGEILEQIVPMLITDK